MSPPPHARTHTHTHLPLFYCKQLDRSAVIGCTSSTWAALPFLAVPNGAANSMLLAGWQTGRWEPANGRLDETQAPVNCTVGSLQPLLLWPAGCHLRFGVINPLRLENHSCPSLFNYSVCCCLQHRRVTVLFFKIFYHIKNSPQTSK